MKKYQNQLIGPLWTNRGQSVKQFSDFVTRYWTFSQFFAYFARFLEFCPFCALPCRPGPKCPKVAKNGQNEGKGALASPFSLVFPIFGHFWTFEPSVPLFNYSALFFSMSPFTNLVFMVKVQIFSTIKWYFYGNTISHKYHTISVLNHILMSRISV